MQGQFGGSAIRMIIVSAGFLVAHFAMGWPPASSALAAVDPAAMSASPATQPGSANK
jgi:hypothetical protein